MLAKQILLFEVWNEMSHLPFFIHIILFNVIGLHTIFLAIAFLSRR